MRSDRNGAFDAFDAQCPSTTTGAPGLNSAGVSPSWWTATVCLPSVTRKFTPSVVGVDAGLHDATGEAESATSPRPCGCAPLR